MTEKAKNKIPLTKRSGFISLIKTIIAVTIAFVAAVCFRQSAGIVSMFPIAFLLCGGLAFLNTSRTINAVILVSTVFAVNTIEQPNIESTLLYTALCLLAFVLFLPCVKLIKAGKKYGYILIIVSLVFCIILSLVFVGNPFSAIKAKNQLNEYTQNKYPNSENNVLGNFTTSNIYYNYHTKAYEIQIGSDKYPTEAGIITYQQGTISDGFIDVMEKKLCEPYVSELVDILRKNFPNDYFVVDAYRIITMPGDSVLDSKQGELNGKIRFEIMLDGIQTANAMENKVKQYTKIIEESGFLYNEITFKGGIGPWMVRSVTVPHNRPFGFDNFVIQHVHPATSNRFNEYVARFISIELCKPQKAA